MAAVAAAYPAIAANCNYQTVAGLPVTFRGENVPVREALFHSPSAVATARDGTIYIADTGNNRVRAVAPGGVVRTVAGTGDPDVLNRPEGLAVAEDGSVFVSDTGNHRVVRVWPDGHITTVAGEGHARFRGDNGPAVLASLNEPKDIGFDAAGNLFILDSVNRRVRRVDEQGTITTVAGANPLAEYDSNYCCDADEPVATEAKSFAASSLAVAPDGTLYVLVLGGVRKLGPDGVLRFWLHPSHSETKITSEVPLESLKISPVKIALGPDGTIFLLSYMQVVAVAGGVARPLTGWTGALGTAADAEAALIIASTGKIMRITSDGTSTVLWSMPAPVENSPATAGQLNGAQGVAVGPDGTIYVSETNANRIMAVDPSGKIRRFAGADPGQGVTTDGAPALGAALHQPRSLAVDSRGTLYFAEPAVRRVRKIGADGRVLLAFTTPEAPMAVRIDGQDRVYVFSGRSGFSQVLRYDSNGTKEVLADGFLWPSVQYPTIVPGMAVAKDGTVYVGVTVRLSDSTSTVLRIKPDLSSDLVPMEESLDGFALAVDQDGHLYGASYTKVKKVLPDGTVVTVRNGDGLGFWGEHGHDSLPFGYPFPVSDLVFDNHGGLLAADYLGVRRIDLTCEAAPGPRIAAMVDAASSLSSLKLTPGMLFSIYGARLGPDAGVGGAPDERGYFPRELGGTQVFVNGIAAPVLYASAGQVNAIVPFDLDIQSAGRIEVVRNGQRSDVFSKKIGHRSPVLFSKASDNGYVVISVNEDGTMNGPDNPAKLGSIVMLFGTGFGSTAPQGTDAKVSGPELRQVVQPAKIQIGSKDAEVLYQGTSPGIVEGFTQINLRIPKEFELSGPTSAAISVGAEDYVPQPKNLRIYLTP